MGRVDSMDEQTLQGDIGKESSASGLPVLHLKKALMSHIATAP